MNPKAHHDPEDDCSGMVADGPHKGQWLSHWGRTFATAYLPPVRLSPSRLDLPEQRAEMHLFYRYVDPSDGEGGVWKLTDESRQLWGDF